MAETQAPKNSKTYRYLHTRWLWEKDKHAASVEVKVTKVNESNNTVTLDSGETISLIELDLSGAFTKIGNPLDNPEVANKIKGIGNQHKILNTYHKAKKDIDSNNESLIHKNDRNMIKTPSTPEEQMICSAISIERKNHKDHEVYTGIHINVKFMPNFDVEKIINTAIALGVKKDEAIQTVINHIEISVDDIRDSLKKHLINVIK